jgi:hypothetical protein
MDDCVRQFYNLGWKGRAIQMASLLSWLPYWNPDASLENTAKWFEPLIVKGGGLYLLHTLAVASEKGQCICW